MQKFFKQILLVFFGLLSLFNTVTSCQKLKPTAEVTIISAETLSDGSVKLAGKVTKGNKEISSIGFCYDDKGSPEYHYYAQETVRCKLDGDYFSTVIEPIFFDPYKKYYFRAFVWSQGNTLHQSKIVHFETVDAEPVTPACFPADNFINIGSSPANETFYNFDMPDAGSSNQLIRASSSSYVFSFLFDFKPKTGIYTTVSSDPYGAAQIKVSFYTGSIAETLQAGSKVYVNEVSQGKYEITLCDAPWKLYTSTFYITTKVVTP